jgi:hypothetical protein
VVEDTAVCGVSHQQALGIQAHGGNGGPQTRRGLLGLFLRAAVTHGFIFASLSSAMCRTVIVGIADLGVQIKENKTVVQLDLLR